MTTPSNPHEGHNSYFIDVETGAEMARLILQDQVITKGMGGLLAERSDVSSLHRVLDIACGPGGWALELAYAYPKIAVVGMDLSHTMIEYACAQAQVQNLDNATFHVMDMLKPLAFPDNSFDLINIRLIGFLSPAEWPRVLQEFLRITRPGGIIRWTEADITLSTSFALQSIQRLVTRALKKVGRSFSPDGEHSGLTALTGRLLREAGCQRIGHRAHVIEWSAGTEAHEGFAQDHMISMKTCHPFLVHNQMATQKELDQLYEQLLQEMRSDDFSAVFFLLTVWGEKPS